LNLVAWRKKNPGICIPGSLPSELLIARIYSDHWRSKTPMVSKQILAHRIGCQRASPPVLQKGTSTAKQYASAGRNVNNGLTISTGIHRRPLAACGVVGCARRTKRVTRGRWLWR